MLRQTTALAPKTKLNQTLRSWLPILQSGLDDLKDTLETFCEKNPFVSVETPIKTPKNNFFKELSKNSVSDTLEALSVHKNSLYETLIEQINPPLFPTQRSQDIAYKIIECINSEGYFEYDMEILGEFEHDEVEKIRQRFAYLEPVGVGAKELKESFLFQLDGFDVSDEIYNITREIILKFENLESFIKVKNYEEAINIIRKFKNPPAIEYMDDEPRVLADIVINVNDGKISVELNDEYYPEILLDIDGLELKDEFVSTRIKEAKDLVDALDMRKATLKKIGLMIVEYQYEYFFGGDIKPMKLKDIAHEIQRSPSTISRAIANKYIQCSRGTIPLKSFFATALDDDISNATIKNYILNLIKNENHARPLSDLKILELIQNEFNIQMVRRTITKYRKILNIASSSERKRIYSLGC